MATLVLILKVVLLAGSVFGAAAFAVRKKALEQKVSEGIAKAEQTGNTEDVEAAFNSGPADSSK